jgi:hypothetical protein
MQIESLGVALAVLLPLLLLVEGLIAAFLSSVNGWNAPRLLGPIATWSVLTALTVWCVYLVAFVGVHALLFTFGTEAAWVGVIVTGVILVATPFAWGLVIRRQAHHAAHG